MPYLTPHEFDAVKDNITFKLLNTAANEAYLEETAHVEILDLSLAFFCTFYSEKSGDIYSTRVLKELMSSWNVNEKELLRLAEKNTKRMFGIYLKEIQEALGELAAGYAGDNELPDFQNRQKNRTPMYVLSNNAGNAGAASLFLPGVLKTVADRLNRNLYVIPSSIHEVILIAEGEINREQADALISDVNKNLLQAGDILSNHVYIYRRNEDRLEM